MVQIVSAYQFRFTSDQLDRLFNIVTHAYAETEKMMWGDGYNRIERNEFGKFIDQDEVLVALIKGKVVGGVRYYQLEDNTWTFSLLATDFNELGQGIGRALVHKVEEIVISKGGDNMKIEVLRPENEKVEAKEMISDWYQRMGYKLVKVIPYGDLVPAKAHFLLVPSVFDCYQKKL